MIEPRVYSWIEPGRIAVAERPGGGGRTNRRDRRADELAWWHAQGVRGIVSGMRSRHGLVEYGLAGFAYRWHPLTDPQAAPGQARTLVASALDLAAEVPVLVHVDHPGEWLAGVAALLRLATGAAGDPRDALLAAAADGIAVGPLALHIVEPPPPVLAAAA
ncbi:MAG: hypothetical protein AB1416_03395 [Actinomycetota bacterium]